MLDQNTDRMWYVIGAVIVGAAIILILNGTAPELFASVADTFKGKTDEVTNEMDDIGYSGPIAMTVDKGVVNADGTVDITVAVESQDGIKSIQMTDGAVPVPREMALQFDGVDDYLEMRYNFGDVGAFTIGAEITDAETMNFLANHRAGHGWRMVDVNDMKVNGSGSWSINHAGVSEENLGPYNLRHRKTPSYVVITWDGTTANRYINGELVESDEIIGQFVLETILIGGRVNSSTNEVNGYASGTISDFFVAKDHAFSAGEVREVYENGIHHNEQGLVIHYDFEEGTGTTVYDKSGNGNHGTITGAQWTPVFKVSKNGTYQIKVEDNAGNVRTREVTVYGI